jgi:hypothetical protein
MDAFLDSLDEEAEQLTLGQISHVDCSPMPAVALAKLEGKQVSQEEIVAASDARAKQREELLHIFSEFLSVYAGNEAGTDEINSDIEYTAFARAWCQERGVSVLVIDGSPKEKLGKFFELLEEMGLDDVEELEHETEVRSRVCTALIRLKLLTVAPPAAWEATRPVHFDDADWSRMKELLGVGFK